MQRCGKQTTREGDDHEDQHRDQRHREVQGHRGGNREPGAPALPRGDGVHGAGNLVHSLGSGWAWISRFDDDLLPLVADLEDIEKAEKSLALKVKFA